jgi:hypothetical protein
MAAGGDGRRKRAAAFCSRELLLALGFIPEGSEPIHASTDVWAREYVAWRAGDRRGRRMKGWTAGIASDREFSWW